MQLLWIMSKYGWFFCPCTSNFFYYEHIYFHNKGEKRTKCGKKALLLKNHFFSLILCSSPRASVLGGRIPFSKAGHWRAWIHPVGSLGLLGRGHGRLATAAGSVRETTAPGLDCRTQLCSHGPARGSRMSCRGSFSVMLLYLTWHVNFIS